MVERLVEAKQLGTLVDRQTTTWLDSIDATLRERLAKAGLAAGRQKTELKAFVSACMMVGTT